MLLGSSGLDECPLYLPSTSPPQQASGEAKPLQNVANEHGGSAHTPAVICAVARQMMLVPAPPIWAFCAAHPDWPGMLGLTCG